MSCFYRAYVTWYRYTLSYAQKWPLLLLCSCSCSCSCLRLFSCTRTRFYFWFHSSPANVIILRPVLNRCTWITFYFLKQTTVCLVKIKNFALQNHFWTKSESNMYPMLLHRMLFSMYTILLLITLPRLLCDHFKDLSWIVALESCSTSWNKQLFASKKLKTLHCKITYKRNLKGLSTQCFYTGYLIVSQLLSFFNSSSMISFR